uniref:Uncharacterized protein n=1 Tax=Picea sitchensis TaxID=3332 RepID=D5AAG1_PICSI|nr:unknown [Picea sitchensis]
MMMRTTIYVDRVYLKEALGDVSYIDKEYNAVLRVYPFGECQCLVTRKLKLQDIRPLISAIMSSAASAVFSWCYPT